MDVVAIIPARGGSKGIPRKNLVPLGGKPLIAWTIVAALEARLGRVIVSTDSQEIAEVSKTYGAEVPFIRPEYLATDGSGSYGVVEHALHFLKGERSKMPEMFVLLQPTSPLRTPEDIITALKMGLESNAPAVIGICKAVTHPWMTRKLMSDSSIAAFVEVGEGNARRQDFPTAYMVNGAIFVVRTTSFFQEKTFEPVGTLGYVMPRERSIDIDTLSDLELAELALSRE